MQTTAEKVISALAPYDVRRGARQNEYVLNSPLRPGSNSHAFKLTIAPDGEHGAYFDHVSHDTGTLYDLARHLDIARDGDSGARPTGPRTYADLADYAKEHLGIPPEVLERAGWRNATGRDGRPAIAYPVGAWTRYRYLDGQKPKYKSQPGYERQWYGLEFAVNLAMATGQPLVICNGEASVLAAQYRGVAACCVAGGEKAFEDRHIAELQSRYRGAVRVAMDCDSTGRTAGMAVAQQLREAGFDDAMAIDLQGGAGFDLADFTRLHEGDAVAHLAQCPEIGAPPRVLYHVSELSLLPPPRWLVRDEIVAGGLSVICAPSHTGKSFICVDRACRLALEGNPVVYVAAEGASGYRQRVRAWGIHHKVNTDKLPMYFYPKALHMMDIAEVDSFIANIRYAKPALIIIDTLLRCMVGGDPNSNADMSTFVDHCNRIQNELGAAVQIVHHTGKSGRDLGAVALFAASDMFLSVENHDGFIVLQQAKAKDSDKADLKTYRLLSVTTDIPDEDGNPVSSCVVIPSEKVIQTHADKLTPVQAKILNFLDLAIFDEAGCNSARIATGAGVQESTLYNSLSTLKKLGYVSQGKRGDPFTITVSGRRALDNYSKNSATTSTTTGQLLKSSQVVERGKYADIEESYADAPMTTSMPTALPDAELHNYSTTTCDYLSSQSTTTLTTPPPLGGSSRGVDQSRSNEVVTSRAKVLRLEAVLDAAIEAAPSDEQKRYERFNDMLDAATEGSEEYDKLARAVDKVISDGGPLAAIFTAHMAWVDAAQELEQLLK